MNANDSHYSQAWKSSSTIAAAPELILGTDQGRVAAGGVDGLLRLPQLAQTPAGRARRVVSLEALLPVGFGPRLMTLHALRRDATLPRARPLPAGLWLYGLLLAALAMSVQRCRSARYTWQQPTGGNREALFGIGLRCVQGTDGGLAKLPMRRPPSAPTFPSMPSTDPKATMCQRDPDTLESIVHQAAAGTGCTVLRVIPPPPGSRRRRLWELEGHSHCPVIGVCLPIAALRRIVEKVSAGPSAADDFELHCVAVTDAKLRTRLAEALQRELDRRYLLPLRQAARAKTSEALAAWWGQSPRGHDVAGPLWAVLTHPRCTLALEHRVLGEVHMLQHQAGMAARVDFGRVEALVEEHAVMAHELGAAQRRGARQASEHAQRCDAQQTEIVRLRAELVMRDSALDRLREDLQALESAAPGLKSRFELGLETQRQTDRIRELERVAAQLQQEGERRGRRADELAAELHRRREQREAHGAVTLDADQVEPAAPQPPTRLDAQAVLCVGGRTAAVPLYRHIVEKVGGRFLHHDGGEEDSSARLDATLAAADMVICQTGCISHNAYWRVKDHCKRTGKRCVFVESPSTAGLKRALATLQPAVVA